jgi:hypothetical protein
VGLSAISVMALALSAATPSLREGE